MSDDSVAAVTRTQRGARAGAPKYERLHARGSDYSWAAAGVPEMGGAAGGVGARLPCMGRRPICSPSGC